MDLSGLRRDVADDVFFSPGMMVHFSLIFTRSQTPLTEMQMAVNTHSLTLTRLITAHFSLFSLFPALRTAS